MRGIVVSQHAATRYQERVKPALDYETARAEFERLVEMCDELTPDVDWLPYYYRDQNEGYLVIAPGIACPVVRADDGGLVVSTCCIQGALSESFRRDRNARKREMRRRRRQKKGGRRPVMEDVA